MRLEKLATMTLHELAHRVPERISSGLERHGLGMPWPRAPHGAEFKDYLRDSAAARFYRGVCPATPALISYRFPQWAGEAIRRADAICRHEFEILGYGVV